MEKYRYLINNNCWTLDKPMTSVSTCLRVWWQACSTLSSLSFDSSSISTNVGFMWASNVGFMWVSNVGFKCVSNVGCMWVYNVGFMWVSNVGFMWISNVGFMLVSSTSIFKTH